MLISPIAPKAVWRFCVDHIQLWAIAVCKLLSENIVLIMPTTTQPVIMENDIQFYGLGLCQREMPRTLWQMECHRVPSKKSYAVFMRAAVLPRGCVGIDWRQSYQKKIMPFYASRDGRVFSQLSRIRVEMIRRTGRPVVDRIVQGRLVAAGYHYSQCI